MSTTKCETLVLCDITTVYTGLAVGRLANHLDTLGIQIIAFDVERYAPEGLLRVRRTEDAGQSLWAVFNRVQENALRGGLVGFSAAGQNIVSRPLRSPIADTRFNTDLWRLAEEFA